MAEHQKYFENCINGNKDNDSHFQSYQNKEHFQSDVKAIYLNVLNILKRDRKKNQHSLQINENDARILKLKNQFYNNCQEIFKSNPVTFNDFTMKENCCA